MDVKLVAVDMDGTFLSKGNDYNRERFANIYRKMKTKGIAFVVASGNQYDQISSFFHDDEIIYAAENGAWIRRGSEELYCNQMEVSQVLTVVDQIVNNEDIMLCICGKKSAYVKDASLLPMMSVCFPTIQVIEDFHKIHDVIFKIALVTSVDKTNYYLKHIQALLPDEMEAVSSGFGCIDINIKGCNKGVALQHICDYLSLDPANCMAFGDSGNDIEMLKVAGHSYAMGNACPQVKAVAQKETLSCEKEGVLHILEQLVE